MRRAVVVTMVAAAALVAATPAGAGIPGNGVSLGKSHGLEYMRAKFTAVTSQAMQPVNCDGDAEITGGGGAMSGPVKSTLLNGTFPIDPAGWEAHGSPGGSQPQTLTAYAICGSELTAHQTGALADFLPNSVVHGGGPPCPGDLDPIGGGVRFTQPAAYTTIIRSEPVVPSAFDWENAIHNRSLVEDTLYEFHSVCSDGYEIKYRYSDEVKLPGEDATTAIARCRPKEAVLGGGFTSMRGIVIGYQTPALETRPWDSKEDGNRTPDDGWRARAYNVEDLRVNLRAVAVCKR
jgi:hypothetical protein